MTPRPFDPAENKHDIKVLGLAAGILILTGLTLAFFAYATWSLVLALLLLSQGLIIGLVCGSAIGERRAHARTGQVQAAGPGER